MAVNAALICRQIIKMTWADLTPDTFTVPLMPTDDLSLPSDLAKASEVVVAFTGTVAAIATVFKPEVSGTWELSLSGLWVKDPTNAVGTDETLVKVFHSLVDNDLSNAADLATSTNPLSHGATREMLDLAFIWTDFDGASSNVTLTMGACYVDAFSYTNTAQGLKFTDLTIKGVETPAWS